MHRLSLSICVSIAFALQAPAQDPDGSGVLDGILGKDDAEFVLRLNSAGFSDLANDVMAAIDRAAGKSPDQALRNEMVRLQVQEDSIDREADPLKRVDLLANAIEVREKLIADHAGAPEALDLADRLPDLYGSIGNLITTAIREQGLTAETEQLRERGRSMFGRAVKKFEERAAELNKQLEESQSLEPDEELEWKAMLASYNLIRTQYLRSLLYDPGSFEKTTILDGALDVLTDFQLEYADKLLCFDAFVYEGLCLKEKGDVDGAMSSFEAAIKVRESYEKGAGGLYVMPPEAAGVVASAMHQKMLVLTEKSAFAETAAAARDFFATIPNGIHTPKGRAILSLEAEAYRSLGDQKEMEIAARRLIEVDPNGPGGKRGREILGEVGGGSNLRAVDVMRFAEGAAQNGEFEEAVSRCQQVLILARGTSEATALGSRACLLLGAVLAGHGWLHEAVVVWDTAADRYSEAKEAPECLWRAINGYLTLQGQEQRAFYKDIAHERMSALSKRFPESPYASMAGLIEGRQLEAELKFERAAEAYLRIPAGSAGGSHEEGIYRAGDVLSQLARKLFQEGKTSEAQAAVSQSETLLKQARPALEAAASQTLDTRLQDKMRDFAFGARTSLASLYLVKGVDRAAEVMPLLDGIERDFPVDAAKISTAWSLRSKALQAQGKFDEAMTLLDEQIEQDPNAKWIGASAGALALILDARGKELFKTDPKSEEGDRLWRKAASYYLLTVKGQLDGREAIRVQELESIATRLLVFALHFNGVPEGVESFIDWTRPEGRGGELFEETARVYEAVLPLTPSYRTLISLARTFGFLGRWEEAASRYAELFENEPFADLSSKTIRQEALRAKPELIFAFVEWGVCEREAGIEKNDASRMIRATTIFETLMAGTSKGSKLWWTSKYYQLRTLTDRGEYRAADLGLRDVKRGWNDYDEGKYGFKEKFEQLEAELSKKVFKN